MRKISFTKKSNGADKPRPETINALVISEREIEAIHIDNPIGSWYLYDGNFCSILEKREDGELYAWRPTAINICAGDDGAEVITPQDYYESVNWYRVVKDVYGLPPDTLRSVAIIALVLFGGAMMVLLFFMFVILMGD